MNLRIYLINRLVTLLMKGWADGPPEEQRARQSRMARYNRLPARLQYRAVTADNVPAGWFEQANTQSGALLYLHGGGYTLGAIRDYHDLLARLVEATHLPVLAINYRLAPEHPYPAALDDALTAYRWLLDQGWAAEQLLIAGDSAGGGLTLATLVALRAAGLPLPAGAICLSPWTDLALTGDSIHARAQADPILSPHTLNQYADYYAGVHARTEPLISPLYADLHGLPPLLIQVGTSEILLDDARRLAERARSAGVAVTLQTWEGMFHVFQMFAFLPETRQALRSIAKFTAQRRAALTTSSLQQ